MQVQRDLVLQCYYLVVIFYVNGAPMKYKEEECFVPFVGNLKEMIWLKKIYNLGERSITFNLSETDFQNIFKIFLKCLEYMGRSI